MGELQIARAEPVGGADREYKRGPRISSRGFLKCCFVITFSVDLCDFYMTLTQEFKKSLKFTEVEELLDLALYRPLGFLLAKGFSYTPLTPNQVTLLSLVTGLTSAWFIAQGTGIYFTWGGLLYAVSNSLDCADGQLARLKHNGTPFGRLVDGVVDWIVGVTAYVSLGIGLSAATGNPWIWVLAVGGGVSFALHALVFDYIQQQYLSVVRRELPYVLKELENVRSARTVHDGGSVFRKAGLLLYSRYLGIQQHWFSASDPSRGESPEAFRQHNRCVMRGWSFLGPTTNRTLLAVGCLALRPDLFLWFLIVVGNAYLVLMMIWQRTVRTRRAKEIPPAET